MASGSLPVLIFDGVEEMVHGDFNGVKLASSSLVFTGLRGVVCCLCRKLDSDSLLEAKFWLWLLPFIPLLEERSTTLLVASSICMYFEPERGCLSFW